MNIMKKKPELFKRTGKSSLTLRNFLNNLKDNDLHYENKQITQCVFLGVLRLKPVPSVFSSNVPSVSTTSESTKTKRIKNNNSKELNKNVSKKTNINKVLSGKISKKNPEIVKAAVKKVPSKRSNIKIKLNPKEKMYSKPEPSTSSSQEEASFPNTSNTASPDSIIARTSLTLNTMLNPTKFNPVQNLFDKLKQRRDESYSDAGPSKLMLPVKAKEDLKSITEKYKVCKINASGQNTFNSNGSRKLKKTLHKKSNERLQFSLTSTSPITISDTESTDKKEKDDVIFLDENNSNSSHSSGKERLIIEDIIIINDDTQSKRTSPRHKTVNQEITYQEVVDNRNLLPEEPKSRQSSTVTAVSKNVSTKQLTGSGHCQEVIVIPDEPNQEKIKCCNISPYEKQSDQYQATDNDVFPINREKEVRVSPRLKKLGEESKEVEVVVLADEEAVSAINKEPEAPSRNSMDVSKTQELNITTDSQQYENKNEKTGPRLLKPISTKEKMSHSVKKELIDSDVVIVNEKPRRKKNIVSPSLIPSMLLNAPMLLRSELAQKKSNYASVERPNRKKDKVRNSSNSKPTTAQTKNINKNAPRQSLDTHSKTLQANKTSKSNQEHFTFKIQQNVNVTTENTHNESSNCSLSEDVVCLTDSTEKKEVIDKISDKNVSENVPNLRSEEESKTTPKNLTVHHEKMPEESKQKTEFEECAVQKTMFSKISQTSENKDDDVIIVEIENTPKERVSPRLLRSDLSKQKTLENLEETKKLNCNEEELKEQNSASPRTQNPVSEVGDFINLVEEPDKNVCPRTLRSNQRKSPTNQKPVIEDTILINDDEALPQQKISPRTKKSIQQTDKVDLDEEVIADKSKTKKQTRRLLQCKPKEKPPIKTEIEEHKCALSLPSVAEDTPATSAREKKSVTVENTRWLRSDANRKIKEEVPAIRNLRMVKMERDSLPNITDLGTPKNSKNSLNPSDRLLRSVVKKEASTNNEPEHHSPRPRTLRSDKSQGNSQNTMKEKSAISRPTAKRRSAQKSPQSNELPNIPEQQCSVDVQNGSLVEEIHAPLSALPPAPKKSSRRPAQKSPQSNELRSLPEQHSSVDQQNGSVEDEIHAPLSPAPKKNSRRPAQKSPQSDELQNLPEKQSSVDEQSGSLKDEIHAPLSALSFSPALKKSSRRSAQKSPQSNEVQNLPEHSSVDEQNGSLKDERHAVSYTPAPKKSSRSILNRQSKTLPVSKKVIAAKKEERSLSRKAKSTLLTSERKPKTSMLLRSELAQLKNVSVISVSDIKTTEKKTVKRKGISKSETINSNNQLNKTCEDTSNYKKNKRKAKNEVLKSSEDLSQVQNKDCVQNIDDTNCTNEVVAKEAPITLEENKTKNKPPIVNKTKDCPPEERCTPKQNSGSNRKKSSKRKTKVNVDEEKLASQPMPHQENTELSELCDVTANKTVDTTIFDFDESEPEVLPLRLSDTLKKEKSMPAGSTPSKGSVTPKRKMPKAVDEPITKVQTKVELLTVSDDKSIEKNTDIPDNTDNKTTAKTKTATKKKTIQDRGEEQLPQNETTKAKKNRKKLSPSRNDTSKSDTTQDTAKNVSTGTPSLRQTTITDMFNKVLMKKEKSSVDSIFERSPKEATPQKEKPTENAMPPPRPSRKSSNTELEDSNPYEDDSDCDSRMEWIPEEYAEYKFKYSAKKMMTYKPIHKCKICLLILPTYYKLSKHKLEHAKTENPYNCKHCDQAFSNIEDLTAHLRIHKGKHPYTCKKCDIGFWSKKSLDAHTPIHVLRKVKQPNKRFRCDVCAKEFSKLCDMERHTRVHTGEKPCVCNICNKRFQQSHNLSKHLLTHLHVKPFHCEICNKQFGRNDVLNRHLLTHSVEKPIKCPLCPKGFIRQTQLNNHMKKNHPDAAKIGAASDPKVTEAK